jgi:hypothetical protein
MCVSSPVHLSVNSKNVDIGSSPETDAHHLLQFHELVPEMAREVSLHPPFAVAPIRDDTPTRPHAHTPTRPHAHTPTRPHAHTPNH